MTKEETRQILSIIKLNYPNHFRKMSVEESHNYLAMWSEALKDFDTIKVTEVVKDYIYNNESPFPPNIAQVRSRLVCDNTTQIENQRIKVLHKYGISEDARNDEIICQLFHLASLGNVEWKEDFENVFGITPNYYFKNFDKIHDSGFYTGYGAYV